MLQAPRAYASKRLADGCAAGAAVILNPAPAPPRPLPPALYAAVHILTPNETEAAATPLLKRGVGTVILPI